MTLRAILMIHLLQLLLQMKRNWIFLKNKRAILERSVDIVLVANTCWYSADDEGRKRIYFCLLLKSLSSSLSNNSF